MVSRTDGWSVPPVVWKEQLQRRGMDTELQLNVPFLCFRDTRLSLPRVGLYLSLFNSR